jgi:dipeptidyl-peptidase-4
MVRRTLRHYALAQWWAQRGWAVVQVDGRGTPSRGRAFEREIFGKFFAVPLEDQIEALQSLAEVHPCLDLSRVAIFGWSFGGYLAALAALERPDIIRAAVAGAPVTQWSEYDTHYTERYLGLPQAAGGDAIYARNGLCSRAGDLKTPLMLVHGTADDNVYFHHTLRFAQAAFQAGTSHWLKVLPLPGETHAIHAAASTRALYEAAATFLETHCGQP